VRTFAVVNQKGGCGKTTTAINLSAVFARRGLRTLLVDMDPQSHCAIGLGVPEKSIDRDLGEALLRAGSDRFDPDEFVWEVAGNLDLIPSTIRLAALEAPGGGLHQLPDRDRRLARLLERYAGRYDRCLVDCPPTIGLLTFNALRAVREALIPVETGFFALRGADRQWRTIRQLVERIGRPLACHLVPTLHREASPLSGEILNELRRQFAGQVVPVVIHEDEVVREATSFGQPVIEYAPRSRTCKDLEQLADWLDEHPPQSGVQIEVVQGTGRPYAAAIALSPLGEALHGVAVTEADSSIGRAAELARRLRTFHGRVEQPGPVSERPRSDDRAETPTDKVTDVFGVVVSSRGVRFAHPGSAASRIFVAGDFNAWSATRTPLTFDERLGAHETVVELPPGRYRYRLVIDGRWMADPHNQHKTVNDYGEFNSVVVVPAVQDAP